MPPSRDEDMQIIFKKGAPSQLDCKVYPFMKKETEVLCQSIKERPPKGIYPPWDLVIHFLYLLYSKERWEGAPNGHRL